MQFYTYCTFPFYLHSTMEISIVRIKISILPTLLSFQFSTLLASSDLQTFILPFSISLSSACTTTTTPKTMVLHTKPRDYITLSPSSFLGAGIWWTECGGLHMSMWLSISYLHVYGGCNTCCFLYSINK